MFFSWSLVSSSCCWVTSVEKTRWELSMYVKIGLRRHIKSDLKYTLKHRFLGDNKDCRDQEWQESPDGNVGSLVGRGSCHVSLLHEYSVNDMDDSIDCLDVGSSYLSLDSFPNQEYFSCNCRQFRRQDVKRTMKKETRIRFSVYIMCERLSSWTRTTTRRREEERSLVVPLICTPGVI